MKHLALVASAVLLVAVARPASAADASKPDGACDACDVDYVCCPVPKTEKVTETCFEVTSEQVCIPHFKWPWQKDCKPPQCGRVRTVNRLTEKEVETGERCAWTWEIRAVPRGGCRPRMPGDDTPCTIP